MPTTTEPRQRVSSYQARIERTLTDIFFEVPQEQQRSAGREWLLTHVAHTNGYAICELCGHNPIKRLYFIESASTGRELMIGSECARNYADVDLIDAYQRRMVQTQNRRRNEQRRREQRERNAAARASADQSRSVEWMEANSELARWLNNSEFGTTDRFLRDMQIALARYHYLTERQTEVAERIRQERRGLRDQQLEIDHLISPYPLRSTAQRLVAGDAVRRDLAARADECPQIYNGTYTVTDQHTAEHMTFQIYTPQRGGLEGFRIVKVMRQYSRFEGFGFVGRDGSLVLWRRYLDHADQPYVRWAQRLLTLLEQDVGNTGRVTASGDLGSTEPWVWAIECARACRRCNRTLTTPTSIHAGIGPECLRRVSEETTAARQTTEDARIGLWQVSAYQRRVERDAARAAEHGTVILGSSQRPLQDAVEQQVLLSELGTGEEL